MKRELKIELKRELKKEAKILTDSIYRAILKEVGAMPCGGLFWKGIEKYQDANNAEVHD